MFGITEKLKSVAAAGASMAVAIGLAILGLVWLSIAAFTALASVVTEPAAMCIVAAAAMTPLLIMLVRHRAAAPKQLDPAPVADTPEEVGAVVRLAHSASLLADRSPIAGIALTLGAVFIASRSPSTTPLALHMLAETVERWATPPPAAQTEAAKAD